MEKRRSKRHEISNQCYYTQKLPLFALNARFGICGCVHICPHLPKWPATVFLHVVLWSFALIWSQMQLCNNKINNNGFVCFLKLTNYTKHLYDLHLRNAGETEYWPSSVKMGVVTRYWRIRRSLSNGQTTWRQTRNSLTCFASSQSFCGDRLYNRLL